MRFSNKVVLVTGGARGIGAAIALGFAGEGAHIAVADVLETQGEDTAAQAERLSGRGEFFKTDVSLPDEVDALVSGVEAILGRIDVLVNAAGICPFVDFLDMTPDSWDRVQAVNLRGVFLCSQAVAKVMIRAKTPGRIVSVGSISSIVGGAEQAHYSASKAGINLLTASMAISLGPYGITCNVVLPGPIETDINKDDLADPEKRDYFERRTPLGRIGQPRDVVGPVLFFASEDSSWCTGSTLVVDGGILVNFQ